MIADHHYSLGTIDAEVTTLVLLPPGATTDADQIKLVKETRNGPVFRALRPGFARAAITGGNWGVPMR